MSEKELEEIITLRDVQLARSGATVKFTSANIYITLPCDQDFPFKQALLDVLDKILASADTGLTSESIEVFYKPTTTEQGGKPCQLKK